jgi:hypothetical protein
LSPWPKTAWGRRNSLPTLNRVTTPLPQPGKACKARVRSILGTTDGAYGLRLDPKIP